MTTFAPDRPTTAHPGHVHHQAQGFCTTCGTTWPCWGAQIESVEATALRTHATFGLPRC